MTPKTKRIVDIAATAIPSGLVLLSGIMKFIGGERVVQGFHLPFFRPHQLTAIPKTKSTHTLADMWTGER
ncbi:MAG: hypothetical protein HW407_1788 [Bacteroidetes bacterium]|nr:hypothetical protein [Bacteroidota bacterium]